MYVNTKLALMPILSILYVCENPETAAMATEAKHLQ